MGGTLIFLNVRELKEDTFLCLGRAFGADMKYIAVQGCQLDCEFAQIVTPPKGTYKLGGKPAYAGDLTIQITGYSGQGVTGGTGTGTLQPTSQHVKIEGEMAVLEGDKTTVPIQVTGQGGTVPVVVTITGAGQTYGKGD